MGKEYTANRVLSGALAKVWVDGELWAECTNMTAKIVEERKDVQIGLSKGSKIVALRGEGSLTVDHVYTTKMNLVKNKLKGKDTMVTIEAQMKDPDAVGGKIEKWVMPHACFTETPLFAWARGDLATKEFPFTFPAEEVISSSVIK